MFSPSCMSPVDGLVEFTKETKPFRTKILESEVFVEVEDKIHVRITESNLQLLESTHNYHTGICDTIPTIESCVIQGYECEPYGEQFIRINNGTEIIVGGGYEPTLHWETTTTRTDFPMGKIDAYGRQLYYDFKSCANVDETDYEYDKCVFPNVPSERAQEHRVEVRELYCDGNNSPLRVTLNHPDSIRTNDQIRFNKIGLPPVAIGSVTYWYNNVSSSVERWDGKLWEAVACTIAALPPTTPVEGQLWYDDVEHTVKAYQPSNDRWIDKLTNQSQQRPSVEGIIRDRKIYQWLYETLKVTEPNSSDLLIRLVDPDPEDNRTWGRVTYELMSYTTAVANGFKGSRSDWEMRVLLRPGTASSRKIANNSLVRTTYQFQYSVHSAVQEIIVNSLDEPVEIVILDSPTAIAHNDEGFFIRDITSVNPRSVISNIDLSNYTLKQILTNELHNHEVPRSVNKSVFVLINKHTKKVLTARQLNSGPRVDKFDYTTSKLYVCRSGFEMYAYEVEKYEAGPLNCGTPINDECEDMFANLCTNVVELYPGWISSAVRKSTVFALEDKWASDMPPSDYFTVTIEGTVKRITMPVETTTIGYDLFASLNLPPPTTATITEVPIYGNLAIYNLSTNTNLVVGSAFTLEQVVNEQLVYGHETASKIVADDIGTKVLGLLATNDDCLVATTSPVMFDLPVTIDGVVLQHGDRVLIKDQLTKSENGIYVANQHTQTLVRASDFDQANKIVNRTIFVRSGAVNHDTSWTVKVDMPFIFDPNNTTTQSGIMWVEIQTGYIYRTNFVTSGVVTNPYWNWPETGAALYVGSDDQLTTTDPMQGNRIQYPVGYVVNPTTIVFDPIQPECIAKYEGDIYELAKYEAGVDSQLLKNTIKKCVPTADQIMVTSIGGYIGQTLVIEDTTDQTQPITILRKHW